MQPLSGNQRPDLLTALMNMSIVPHLQQKMHLCRSSSNVPHLPSFLDMLQNPHVLLTFNTVHNTLLPPRPTTLQSPKVARTCSIFHILTSKCASRHNCVHFFDIATSKSGPKLVCFVHFDLEMCFAPQRRALFRHATSKSGPKRVLCTFWLRNVLRATTACTFPTSQLPTFSLAICFAPQLRAIFHLSSGQMAPHPPLYLASLLFDPPEPQIIGKTQCFATFLPFRSFSRTCIFFLLTLSLLWSSLFYSSLFSDSSHLCFSSVHSVGSLTSKLPSIIHICIYIYCTCLYIYILHTVHMMYIIYIHIKYIYIYIY